MLLSLAGGPLHPSVQNRHAGSRRPPQRRIADHEHGQRHQPHAVADQPDFTKITDHLPRAQRERKAAQDQASYEALSEKQITKEMKRLEKAMHDAAKNLEFEKAAQVRDQLTILKEQAFGATGGDSIVPLIRA